MLCKPWGSGRAPNLPKAKVLILLCQELIERGADVEERGNGDCTALMTAAQYGWRGVVKVSLST